MTAKSAVSGLVRFEREWEDLVSAPEGQPEKDDFEG